MFFKGYVAPPIKKKKKEEKVSIWRHPSEEARQKGEEDKTQYREWKLQEITRYLREATQGWDH